MRAKGKCFGKVCGRRLRSFISLRDQDESAARLQNPEDFARVGGQVGPEVVYFHGRDEIKDVVRKGQLRHRALPDLDPAFIDPARIDFLGYGDTLIGIVYVADLSLRGDRR